MWVKTTIKLKCYLKVSCLTLPSANSSPSSFYDKQYELSYDWLKVLIKFKSDLGYKSEMLDDPQA